jgi:creatinine amidohydrolase
MSGIYLQQQNWQSAEQALNAEAVVVFPLGAAAKEHGPHLPLNTDAVTVNWLAEQVRQRLPVVIAPLINASFYPAFVDYPGSISLQVETARDIVVESCLSLAVFGVKHFYVINNGISTERPLAMAKKILQKESIEFDFLRLPVVFDQLPEGLFQQQWGSHADEHETSLMLYIAPELVDMSRAVDDGSEGEGLLSRIKGQGIWSPSGVYGQATLATSEKGRVLAENLIAGVIKDISRLITRAP